MRFCATLMPKRVKRCRWLGVAWGQSARAFNACLWGGAGR